MENIIEFKQVRKSFGAGAVLNELSFEIKKNQYVALIGNNGCGKTTSINILCNLIAFDSGEVRVFEKPLTKDYVGYKSQFGMVLSKPYYIEEFTVSEHLAFVGRFQNISRADIKERIHSVLDLVDLLSSKSVKIKDLSSGNQMKVSLASALIHAPDVLILDEPFVNLDIKSVENIIHVLESVKSSKTMLITSHNLDLVTGLCDVFLIMEGGKIINTIHRADFATEDDIKEKVKDLLAQNRRDQKEISWLVNKSV
jgi:ABC-2 type transport system ATP-binding protein